MAYKYTNEKGKDYYLHHSKNDTRTLYFFKGEQGEGALDEVPEGYTVAETNNGLPVLKKAGGEKAGSKAGGSKAGAGSKSRASNQESEGKKAGAGGRAKK